MENFKRGKLLGLKNGSHLSNSGLDYSRKTPDYSRKTLMRYGDAICFKDALEMAKIQHAAEEGKSLVCNGSDKTLLWREDLYGIPRISVHGSDSICVATRKEDVLNLRSWLYQQEDPQRCMRLNWNEERWNEKFHHNLMNAVIYEVEKLAEAKLELCEGRVFIPKKPFGLVSVNLGPKIVCDEASGHKETLEESEEVLVKKKKARKAISLYAVDSVIDYLQENLKNNTTFFYNETAKLAVSALQLLYNTKLTADEIEVYVLKKDLDGRSNALIRTRDNIREVVYHQHEKLNDFDVKLMPMKVERSVDEYVTLIKKLSKDGISVPGTLLNHPQYPTLMKAL